MSSPLTHENGTPSGTKALYTAGVIVVLVKYLVSGLALSFGDAGLTFSDSFDATGSVGLILALGGVFRSKNFIQAKWQAATGTTASPPGGDT